MNERNVLVVDADPGMQRHLSGLLQQWGYTPVLAHSVEEAFAALTHTRFVFSLVDGELGRPGGLGFLRHLRSPGGDPGPIIVLADPGHTTRSEETPAPGADAILRKPIERPKLEKAVQEVLSRPRHAGWQVSVDGTSARLEREIALWRSPKMRRVWEIVQQASRADVPVLIRGETGTGKGLVARAIHHQSPRQDRPFVTVNCAAVPGELLESELFGQGRGDVTGAEQLRTGKFESANHGTIFLNQVGDLPPALQAKLVNLLRDGEFSRVGGQSTVKVDVRLLAATSQDLERAVEAGRFRDDLYYRLNVIQIVVPSLRERPEEIPLLANYFIERYSREFQREGFTLPPKVVAELLQHRYPGNVRELENFVKRMILLNDPGLPGAPQFPVGGDEIGGDTPEPAEAHPRSLKEIGRAAARAAEREAIAKALEQTGWNRVRAARLLRISYRALLYKIKDAGLGRDKPSSRFRKPSDLGTPLNG